MVQIEELPAGGSAPPKHAWSLPKASAGKLNITEEGQDAAQGPLAAPVLSVSDAERYVEGLRDFEIEDVGSSGWIKQHEMLEKLNLQAHQSARSHTDEFVLESFITFDKLPFLIRDLLLVDCWREHVFPRIVKDLAERRATMRAYFVLYHEATVINLLEVLLYHAHGCEAAGDSLVELVDYCARKVAVLNSGVLQKALSEQLKENTQLSAKDMAEKMATTSPAAELESQANELQFQVAVTAAAVLRFLCEHIESIPLSVFNRMLQTHDVMLLLIPLIENPPWTRRRPDGKWQKLVDFKWQAVEPVDLLKVTKNEGQAWLALYYLICSAQVRQRYHFNSFRKGQLLRVRKYLNEVMLDQLPFLADVQRFIDELTVADVPEPTAAPATLLLEQVAVMRENIVRGRDWSEVAKQQLASVFTKGDAQDEDLRRLASVYSSDWVDEVAGETRCGSCGKEAVKKCGRCGIEWYCSRECQVKQWKTHKQVCDLITAHKRPDSS